MDIYQYFEANASAHSRTNAYLLSLLSYYIYEDSLLKSYGQAFEERFENFFGGLSVNEPLSIKPYLQADSTIAGYPYDTQVVVLSNSKIIVVSFRGSEAIVAGVRDWLTNLAHFMMDAPPAWGPVQVHAGFYKALDSKYQSVKNQIGTFQNAAKSKKLFLTGHSLGGALATLCAYRLVKVDGLSVAGLYLFGAPRVGDNQFSKQYAQLNAGDGGTLWSKTHRWVKDNDFAAKLPIQGGPLPIASTLYHHVGVRNFITSNGGVQMNALEPTPTSLPIPPNLLSNTDHDMSRYSSSMYKRISDSPRISAASPLSLVKGDLLGTAIERRGDSSGLGEHVSEIAAVKRGQKQIVTAVRAQNNALKLITWRVEDNNSVFATASSAIRFYRSGDSGGQAGAASDIDLIDGSNGRVVTSCRDSSGTLRLICWSIQNLGKKITRIGDSANAGEAVKDCMLQWLSANIFLSACRTMSDKLKLITWRLNNNGSISRRSDSGNAAGTVREISLLKMSNSDSGSRVITSVRDNGGSLKLIVWGISSTGIITRLGDSGAQGPKAALIRSIEDEFKNVVTATRTDDGNFVLTTWNVSAAGNVVNRLDDSGSQAGKVSESAMMRRPGGVVTAVRTSSGDLRLIAWRVSPQGKILRVKDSATQAGAASFIVLCRDAFDGNASIVTWMRDSSNSLRSIIWRDWV